MDLGVEECSAGPETSFLGGGSIEVTSRAELGRGSEKLVEEVPKERTDNFPSGTLLLKETTHRLKMKKERKSVRRVK